MILEWMNDPPHGRIGTALVDDLAEAQAGPLADLLRPYYGLPCLAGI
jgi:hypothetical protein